MLGEKGLGHPGWVPCSPPWVTPPVWLLEGSSGLQGPVGKPAGRRDSASALQTVLQQKGKRIDMDVNAAGEQRTGPRCPAQLWEVLVRTTPFLRAFQSAQPELQLKACLPHNTACQPRHCCFLVPQRSTPTNLTRPFGQVYPWPNTMQGAQPPMDQWPPSSPGLQVCSEELKGPCSAPSSRKAGLQLQQPHLLLHSCNAFSSWPPLMSHYSAFVYTKLSLNFPYSLMQNILLKNPVKKPSQSSAKPKLYHGIQLVHSSVVWFSKWIA